MSESSGIFTFPSTGYWLIYVQLTAYGGYAYGRARIHTHHSTNTGSSYNAVAVAFANVSQNSGYGGGSSMAIIDVTDVSTHRVRFRQDTSSTSQRYISLNETEIIINDLLILAMRDYINETKKQLSIYMGDYLSI